MNRLGRFYSVPIERTTESSHVGFLGVLLHLGGENAAPYVTRTPAEADGDTVLSLLQLLNQFDAGQYSPSISKRLEAWHGGDSEFDAAMILFHDIVQVLAGAYLYGLRTPEVEFVSHAHTSRCGMTGLEAIEGDATRLAMTPQGLPEEDASRRQIAVALRLEATVLLRSSTARYRYTHPPLTLM